jgi:hypothetical protein
MGRGPRSAGRWRGIHGQLRGAVFDQEAWSSTSANNTISRVRGHGDMLLAVLGGGVIVEDQVGVRGIRRHRSPAVLSSAQG